MLTENDIRAEMASIWSDPANGKGKAAMQNPFAAREKEQARCLDMINRFISDMVVKCPATCHVRACRRARRCIGPLVATDLFADRVKAQKMLGMKGLAYQTLPACLHILTPPVLPDFESAQASLKIYPDDPRGYKASWHHCLKARKARR